MDIQRTVTYWSEDFVVEIWVSELTSLRIYCDFRIVRKDNEQLIASGTSQWSILNLDTKRLESTDFLADKLTVVLEQMTASHNFLLNLLFLPILQRCHAYMFLEIAVEGRWLREVQAFTYLVNHQVRVLQQHFGLCDGGAV